MKGDNYTVKNKEYILSINPCIYGLNYHDPGAAIISEGKIMYLVEEERLNGIKGSKGIFPSESIKRCLDFCGITWNDVTKIVIGYEPEKWMERCDLELEDIIVKNKSNSDNLYNTKEILNRIIESNLIDRYKFFQSKGAINALIREKCKTNQEIEIEYVGHHLSHIASSYEFSGFTDAVGVVVDGIGENECTTIWKIHNHIYTKLMSIKYPNSLGYFYAIATKFLGFEPWHHEGKTMALAAYGKYNDVIMAKLNKLVNTDSYIYDVKKFISDSAANYLMIDEEKALLYLEKLMGFSRRQSDEEIDEKYIDFAWAVQSILEKAVKNLVNYAVETTGINNVCVCRWYIHELQNEYVYS